MTRLAFAAAVVLLACGDSRGAGFASGFGVTSAPQGSGSSGGSSSGSSSSSTGEAEDSAGSSSSSGVEVFDMGPPPDFGPVQPPGCKGKIDFLFLISSFYTMKTEQDQLLASLPGFFDTITATFPDFDTHIMVANTTGAWTGWVCEHPHLCGQNGTCGENAEDYVCGPDTWLTVTKCDETLGAGLTFNAGGYATNKRCELYGGHRYITIPGEPDPTAAFDCVARVGTSGHDPRMGDALVAAVSPELNGPEGCNAGFLRPDALLVVTMITDVEDDQSKMKPADWYKAVVDAKGSAASAVMLAIIPQYHEGEPPPGCVSMQGTPDEKQRVRDLIEMFPYHFEGDTCAPTYVPFFEQAVALVEQACNSFIPQ
ncbi:MAG TPA: hypothetical protein VIK91_11790 [Nannocystis sp.]